MLTTIDQREVAKEAVQILRAEHPGWRGDRILNAEVFLKRVGQDSYGAAAFANALDDEKDEFSTLLGVSPDRVSWMANRIRDGIGNPEREQK